MPRKGATRKDKPVPLEELKFSGDPHFILGRLKGALAERDQYIMKLEQEFATLDSCASRVWTALEEAETLASRMIAVAEEAKNWTEAQRAGRTREMSQYVRMFREAKDTFQRLRA